MSGFLPTAPLQVVFNCVSTCKYKMQEMSFHVMLSSRTHLQFIMLVFTDPHSQLKFCAGNHNHPNSFFGSPNSMKIIPLNEPEQIQLIKHNFDNEHHHFTFKYLPKWWQFINVELKGSIHYILSVKRQLMSDACTWTSF